MMNPAPPDPLVDAVIEGRWRVLRPIGSGGMGTVYLAERVQLGRPVAVKVLHAQHASQPDFVRRFDREARAISRLQHAHCISILDFGVHDGRPYIVMELVRGRALTSEIGEPSMTPVRAVQLTEQLLLGLEHAHQHGIVHRDLKPDNVMLTELPGVGELVKILDFGFAHLADSTSQSSADLVPGTPSYMSPEQARGERTDLRTDLYSVGVILYQLCTGDKPFSGSDPFSVLKKHIHTPPTPARATLLGRGISDGLDRVILRALAKDREQRFASAAEFRQALLATREGRRARRGSDWTRTSRIVAALAAVALVVGLGALLTRGRSSTTSRAVVTPPAAAPAPPMATPPSPASATPSTAPATPPTAPATPPTAPATPPTASPTPSTAPATPSTAPATARTAPTTPPTAPATPSTAPAAPAAADATMTPAQSRAAAEQLIAAGHLVEAERLLMAAVARDPRDADLHLALGSLYFARVWRKSALDEWATAIALQPLLRHDPTLQHHLCTALDARSRRETERFLQQHFGAGVVGVMNDCMRHTRDAAVLQAAVEVIQKSVGPSKVDARLVARRQLEIDPNCDVVKRAVETVGRLRIKQAAPALFALEKERSTAHPPARVACLGTAVKETLAQLR